MALVLTATGAFVYLRMKDDLETTVDSGLRSRGDDAAALADEGFRRPGHSPLTERGENLAQIVSLVRRVVDGTPGYRTRALLTSAELRRARGGPIFVERRRVAGVDSPGPAAGYAGSHGPRTRGRGGRRAARRP